MGTFILRRIVQSIIVIFLVSLIVFFGTRMLPGDPILMAMTKSQLGKASLEQVNRIRHELGLDRPVYIQYFDWVSHVVRGDLGTSITSRSDVSEAIKQRLPISMYLGILAFILSNLLGIPAGIIAAVRRGGWLDIAVTSVANLGVAVPVFWLGLLLIYFFGLRLQWLPIFGFVSPLDDLGTSMKGIILPVFCLAVPYIASAARLTRSSMLEVMRQDYIRTAWSKGLKERVIVIFHALKNSLIPVVTLQGMSLSQIIGGSVIIESVFGIPGIGRLAQQAMIAQDYPVVQAIVLLAATIVLAFNLIVDVSYGWIDPRVRYS